ncbi:MAG: adenylate/guanylate cyclase domain-containing protein [Verrucomicrobiales bacterium]|nr:adenylate/guanylate cyclase domain-containing protein [Verrucomicrobiales bacterium]
MKGHLKLIESGEILELTSVSIIGRSAECQIAIPDPRVSRRHAMVRKQDGGFYLFDLGSFNGSYLNGSRVTAAKQLKNGDIISLAEHEFQFQQDGETMTEDLDELGGSTIALIRSTPVIILVSDIMGYSAMSEAMEADELAQIIGGWYSDVEAIISSSGGTVDKFIGDCVLAYWTKVNTETIQASLRTSAELFESCNRIYGQHSEIFDRIGSRFNIGLALHAGKVAYGGLSQGESTLVGDPVNLTFRLESLTRQLQRQVLLTGDFHRQIPQGFVETENLGVHKVKGRAQGVEVFALNSFPQKG